MNFVDFVLSVNVESDTSYEKDKTLSTIFSIFPILVMYPSILHVNRPKSLSNSGEKYPVREQIIHAEVQQTTISLLREDWRKKNMIDLI